MPVKQKPRAHYSHKKHPKHFVKVYLPYLPLLVSVLSILSLHSYWRPRLPLKNNGVLAYATNISREGLLESTNFQRLANKIGALAINETLNKAAQTKAEDMAKRNYWSHQTPDGKEPWHFFEQAGYSYQKAGENLAYGFDNNKAAVAGWMNSKTHRDNLLDDDFLEVGFGIANNDNYQNSGPQTIVVAMYGRSINSPSLLGTDGSPQDTANPLQVGSVTITGEQAPDEPKKVSVVQTVTRGYAPWSSFLVGVFLGWLVFYLLFRNGRRFHKVIVRGERFVLHHPLVDITVISLIVLALILFQSAGSVR